MFLENAKRVALEDMKGACGPVQIAGSRQSARQIGIGFAVAKGWAIYNGNGEFQITTEGVKALAEIHQQQ